MSTSPTTAPSTCEMFSTKPHPPKADARPLVSSSAYQRVPSPKVLARAQPYANGRTPTWPTSTQPEPATHPTEAINGHYRTRQTHRQRLPQPHQLPTPNAPHRRTPRHLHPHPPLKSYQSHYWTNARLIDTSDHRAAKKSALLAHQRRGNHHRIDSCAHWTTHCDNCENTR